MAAMPYVNMQEPPGYRQLCAKLQTERNPAKFRVLVEKVNRLLREYEQSSASEKVNQLLSPELSLEVLVSAANS
jgi:hypothetical protein